MLKLPLKLERRHGLQVNNVVPYNHGLDRDVSSL